MSKYLCEYFLRFALSAQEREVIIQFAKVLPFKITSFEFKDVRDKMKIKQHSHLSAIVSRLIKKGVLARVHRGRYKFTDKELLKYIRKEK